MNKSHTKHWINALFVVFRLTINDEKKTKSLYENVLTGEKVFVDWRLISRWIQMKRLFRFDGPKEIKCKRQRAV